MKQLLAWLDNRTGWSGILHEALYERIPGGARWRYVWGSTLVFTFVIQMITGIFLWAAYSPSAQTAWESVYYIQEHMFLGSIVRGIHHFAAQAMVVLMAIHLIQVIIDGAYKAPREVNFWLGLVLMQIVLALGLTGYLLPWDQKGYYATQVSTEIMGATPIIGQQLQFVVQGGPEYGHHTLTRFFALHAGILPASLIAFLGLHIYVFRRHGITVPEPERAPTTTFWPDQVLKDGVACLGVLAVVMGLAIFKGAELSAPANPAEAYSAARPEWYFLFLFRFLKFEAVEHFGLAFGAIYLPGALMTLVAAMPIIAWWKNGHKFNVVFTWTLMVAIVVLTGMALYEDANDEKHQASIAQAEADAHRAKELAKLPTRIPVQGASFMLQNDPYKYGPRIFARQCASCHRWNGHNGMGQPVMQTVDGKSSEAPATAADLAGFGTREWMRRILIDYENVFAPIKNSRWHKNATKDGKLEDVFHPFTSQKEDEPSGMMAGWSKTHSKILTKPEHAEDLAAILEYFAAKADHPGDVVNEKLLKRGKEILDDEAPLAGNVEMESCFGCHAAKFIDEPGGDAPNLRGYGYGSKEWLKQFILDPSFHYGSANQMPGYEGKMTAERLDLLVRWMIGDYHKPQNE
ncbi:MAG: cytochrome b N-terminal domain-containing protein [Planctomycetota bacterium]|nr:cytochrome b N-terminal domain-containing protein [Planctomycetota bacterium]